MILKIKTDNQQSGSFKFFDQFEEVKISEIKVENHPPKVEGDPSGVTFKDLDDNVLSYSECFLLPELPEREQAWRAWLFFADRSKEKHLIFHQAYLMNDQGDTIERYV